MKLDIDSFVQTLMVHSSRILGLHFFFFVLTIQTVNSQNVEPMEPVAMVEHLKQGTGKREQVYSNISVFEVHEL